jgi:hypothetical protein
MNEYLQKIERGHVEQAGRYLLKNPATGRKKSKTRGVVIDGHPFPTKETIRWAYCLATMTSYENLPQPFFSSQFTTDVASAKLRNLNFTVGPLTK